jgi:hypothetical protein
MRKPFLALALLVVLVLWISHSHADSANTLRSYNAAGTEQLNTHMVFGSATLSGGTVTVTLTGNAAFSSSSSYKCTVTDAVLNLTAVTYTSGSQFTILGVLTDTVSYHCVGN